MLVERVKNPVTDVGRRSPISHTME
eukprot:COSAG05_NODE_16469_length_345_cov_0.869919_1_plen_24_part_01